MGVTLYVGGHGTRIGDTVLDLHGERCLSSAHRPFGGKGTLLDGKLDASRMRVLLDSGAFTDPPARRLTPAGALARQLAWEREAGERWGAPGWKVQALVSYDRLIDEKWAGAKRTKERWGIAEAETAVRETIDGARYLAAQRGRLAGRTLVLACQGVDELQYDECAAEVLAVARPGDWIGLGGWCILGRWQRRWLPTFWAAMHRVVPKIAASGVAHVHLFGCLWLPAVAGLLWLADRHGLTVSVDSARPLMDVTRGDVTKAGALSTTWEGSVAAWRERMATVRQSHFYREPPSRSACWRQGMLGLVMPPDGEEAA
jgi:hypothetical protein